MVAPDGSDPELALPGFALAPPEEALRLAERDEAPDVIVVAAAVDDSVAFAQRLHRVDRSIALVLLAEPERLPSLTQSVMFAPFLGPDVGCRSAADPLLAAEVAELAEQAAQRRRFRAALASAGAQLTAATLERHPQARRLAGRLLDDAPLAIVALAADGTVSAWNRRSAETLGRLEREAVGQPLESLLTLAEPDELRTLLERATAQAGEPATAILELREDGGSRFFEATASATGTGDATVLLMLRDETARVEAAREREAARAELSFLVEAGDALAAPTRIEDAFGVLAQVAVPWFADATIVDLVEEAGLRRVAVAGRDPDLLATLEEVQRRYPPSPDSPQPAARTLRRAAPLLLQLDKESLRETCVDEEHYALMLRVAPRSAVVVPLVARGRTLGALTFIRRSGRDPYDEQGVELARRVGERAAIHLDNVQLLKTAQDRARAARVLDAIGDGVFLLDREERVLLWNPAAERALGVASAEAVGRRLGDVLSAWAALAPAVPVAAVGEAARPETVPVQLGEHELWLSIAGIALEEGTVYAFRDAASEAALERMKSDFVATVSHELRTPLASVYGAALTLERPGIADDVGRRRQLTRLIVEEGERLAQLVDDILLASTLDSGRIDLARELVDVRDVAVRAVEAARAALPDPGRVRFRRSDPARAVGDAQRIRQVLANLIDNALKYSPPDAPVIVELERRTASIRVWVRDEGIGIPASEQGRIFEKFYRADPDLTRGVGGTGLGLYICRELVRQMHGRIGVESRVGKGSSFFFELPRAA